MIDSKAAARLQSSRRMTLPSIVQQTIEDYAALVLQPDATEALRMELARAEAKAAAAIRALAEATAKTAGSRKSDSGAVESLEKRVRKLEIAYKLSGRPCKTKGCEDRVHARGLCAAHYQARRLASKNTVCSACGALRLNPKPGMCRECWFSSTAKKA